jgi:hypothetical protein
MLAERINDWTLEWKKEGEKLGLELGEKRGLEIGKEIGAKVGAEEEARRLVSRLIRLKYGDLPAWGCLNLIRLIPINLNTGQSTSLQRKV